MGKNISVVTIHFSSNIARWELPLFRGAVIALMDRENAPVFFHNHTESGYRYSYPIIQYKIIDGKAAIVCIGKGVECVGQFFVSLKPEIQIGHRKTMLLVENVDVNNIELGVTNQLYDYSISGWLPLNQDNVTVFDNTESLVERVIMLENILTGNILSMAKGVELHIAEEIKVMITSIDKDYTLMYKDVKMRAMDLRFKSNILLPDNIGLGKGVSIGMGVIKKL